jgi:hypothetical protein
MPMVRAMTFTADSLLSRAKLDCDGGYDVVVKGLNVVVIAHNRVTMQGDYDPDHWPKWQC